MDDLAPPLVPLEVPNSEGNRYPPCDDGEWLSINAAARRLGVTATAIRNRIKRGTLRARPNGNFGKLVRMPLTAPVMVIPTPEEPVTLTPENLAGITVTLTERLAAAHAELIEMAHRLGAAEGEVERLRGHLAFERERAERLSGEVAGVAGLKATLSALRVALETERGWLAEIRTERDRLLNRSWWQRLVG